jgi:hypothetical protein
LHSTSSISPYPVRSLSKEDSVFLGRREKERRGRRGEPPEKRERSGMCGEIGEENGT